MTVQSRYPRFVRDQREFFDELITEDWESYASEDWDRVRRWEVGKLFTLVQPGKILDVGCGCGFHDAAMADHDWVEQVDAIDYSPKSIERADEAYPHAKVSRFVADFRSWDPPASYDFVVSFQVIEHLDDPDRFLEFCKQAARPGGHVAVLTPNRLRLANVRRLLKRQEPELCDPQHYREYSTREIRALGRSAGLNPVSAFGYQLHGLGVLDNLDLERRLVWGERLRAVATNIGVLFQKT